MGAKRYERKKNTKRKDFILFRKPPDWGNVHNSAFGCPSMDATVINLGNEIDEIGDGCPGFVTLFFFTNTTRLGRFHSGQIWLLDLRLPVLKNARACSSLRSMKRNSHLADWTEHQQAEKLRLKQASLILAISLQDMAGIGFGIKRVCSIKSCITTFNKMLHIRITLTNYKGLTKCRFF